jgi:two-component system LytT family response regulator
MINTKFVDKYDKSGTIYSKNGTKIPVSTKKKKPFYLHYSLGIENKELL